MTLDTDTGRASSSGRANPGRGPWHAATGRLIATAILACVAAPLAAQQPYIQGSYTEPQPALKKTYVRFTDNANAVLIEPPQPSPNEQIVAIQTHPEHLNNFDYFVGTQLGMRGYRVIEINDYGPETTMEDLLAPIAAAVHYARNLPGVKKVVLVGHSGGGPELSYYQEIAEKGPSACQQPNRLYPCDGKGLTDLPKADALLLLEINVAAAYQMASIDPAVDSSNPRARNPSLDMYAPQNGFDPNTNTASYSADFLKRYWAAMHARSESLIAVAQARLKAINAHTGLYDDDEPFVVPGMAPHAGGARLNLADPKIFSHTHAPHLLLKADGTASVEIVHTLCPSTAPPPQHRDTLEDTARNTTIRHYLSFTAIRTTPEFALTDNDMKGIDWRSSADSAPGNLENISVPTLIMAGSGHPSLVSSEVAFDHAAAKDKEFVAVEGGDHMFRPCRPEFHDSEKHAFDYVDAWLKKRFPAGK